MNRYDRKAFFRFIKKIILEPCGCWRWTGATQYGYGRFGYKEKKSMLAHRFSYEWFNGAIKEGLSLDHLCENPWCVNPDHLEPVSHKENMRRYNFGHFDGVKDTIKRAELERFAHDLGVDLDNIGA